MKQKSKLRFVLLAVLFFLSSMGCSSLCSKIVVLHTNDEHEGWGGSRYLMSSCWLESSDEGWGGAARLKVLIDEVRKKEENVILVSGGDFFIKGGSYVGGYRGSMSIDFMNYLGYNAAVLGNHDFEYGEPRLKELIEKVEFPIISSNVMYVGTESLFTRPYIIEQVGDLRVGILGVTVGAPAMNTIAKDPLAAVEKYIPVLKEKSDFLIVLSHLGLDNDKALARKISGIDVIIGGHSHTSMHHPEIVNGTIIVQAGSFIKYLGKLSLEVEEKSITSCEYCLISIQDVREDKVAKEKVSKYLYPGFVEKDLVRSNTKQSSLGEFITDAMLTVTGADIALSYTGVISEKTIAAGIISSKELFCILENGQPYINIFPLEELQTSLQTRENLIKFKLTPRPSFDLVMVELTVDEIKDLIASSLRNIGSSNYLQINVGDVVNLDRDSLKLGILKEKEEDEIDIRYRVALNIPTNEVYMSIWERKDLKFTGLSIFDVLVKYLQETRPQNLVVQMVNEE